MSAPGRILFLLHAHLPFVRHPDYDRFFEENWFFEAVAETYLPLVQAMRRSVELGVPGTLNLSISPPLIEMLRDECLIEKFSKHLKLQQELAEKEISKFDDGPQLALAKFYRDRVNALVYTWEVHLKRDLLKGFAALEKAGKLNLLTCVGTHPFLPAYQSDPDSIRMHLDATMECFSRAFGRVPNGVWLPECGYFPTLDRYLAEYGLKYFFLETHGVLLASPPPKYGVFTPLKTKAGLYCMGREQASSMEVWSRRTGYPGHPEYREFFKDIASERNREYLGEYFYSGDTPIDTGFKYYRITGSEKKEFYRPWNAKRLAQDHARLFIANRDATISELIPKMNGNKACILCPYDAELFGHWWFEGPAFLESLLEQAAASSVLEFVGADSVMTDSADSGEHEPAFSSWGEGGFGSVWINSETEQYYPQSYQIRAMLNSLKSEVEKLKNDRMRSLTRRYIRQMERELMLFQSSDWAFMIHNRSDDGYARRRLEDHFLAAESLFGEIRMLIADYRSGSDSGKIKTPVLTNLEKNDNIFNW